MASMAVCYSLATLSSTTPLLSHKNTTSIANLKSHERTLQSSLVGTKIAISKTTRPLSSRRLGTSSSEITCSASASPLPSALLFDCDGVLVDTEKDGHRISFNDTFKEVTVPWSSLVSLFFCFSSICVCLCVVWWNGFSCFWGIAMDVVLGKLINRWSLKRNWNCQSAFSIIFRTRGEISFRFDGNYW